MFDSLSISQRLEDPFAPQKRPVWRGWLGRGDTLLSQRIALWGFRMIGRVTNPCVLQSSFPKKFFEHRIHIPGHLLSMEKEKIWWREQEREEKPERGGKNGQDLTRSTSTRFSTGPCLSKLLPAQVRGETSFQRSGLGKNKEHQRVHETRLHMDFLSIALIFYPLCMFFSYPSLSILLVYIMLAFSKCWLRRTFDREENALQRALWTQFIKSCNWE